MHCFKLSPFGKLDMCKIAWVLQITMFSRPSWVDKISQRSLSPNQSCGLLMATNSGCGLKCVYMKMKRSPAASVYTKAPLHFKWTHMHTGFGKCSLVCRMSKHPAGPWKLKIWLALTPVDMYMLFWRYHMYVCITNVPVIHISTTHFTFTSGELQQLSENWMNHRNCDKLTWN